LLVLSAFFVFFDRGTVAAAIRIESAAWLRFGILATLLATGRSIILRIASRRLLAAAARCILATLLDALISFSLVCHINPPLLIVDLIV
jgi:hypothetical protein